jgi:hypothetical protein
MTRKKKVRIENEDEASNQLYNMSKDADTLGEALVRAGFSHTLADISKAMHELCTNDSDHK